MRRTLETLLAQGAGRRFRHLTFNTEGIVVCSTSRTTYPDPLLAVLFDDNTQIMYVRRDEIHFLDEDDSWEAAGEEPLEMRYRLVKLPRTEINASQLEPSDVYDLARLVLAGEDPAHLHFFMCNEAEAAVRDLIYGLNDVLLRPDDFPDIHPDSVVTSNGV